MKTRGVLWSAIAIVALLRGTAQAQYGIYDKCSCAAQAPAAMDQILNTVAARCLSAAPTAMQRLSPHPGHPGWNQVWTSRCIHHEDDLNSGLPCSLVASITSQDMNIAAQQYLVSLGGCTESDD